MTQITVVCAGVKQKVSAVSLGVKDTGSGLKDALSSMHSTESASLIQSRDHHQMASALMAEAFSLAPRQTLPLRLRRRGSRACPARHGARPAPRLSRRVLAGQRLTTATAALRKASELFKHLLCTVLYDILTQGSQRANHDVW